MPRQARSTGSAFRAMGSSVNWLWVPLGKQRTRLLTTGYGLMLYLTFCGITHRRDPAELWEEFPLSVTALGVLSLLLGIGGARVISLVLTAIAGCDFIWRVSTDRMGGRLDMQAAEYIVLVAIPILMLLPVLAVAFKHGGLRQVPAEADGVDESMTRIFRVTALATLFFVSFHKLNTDFFNLAYSCEATIKPLIAKNWKGELFESAASLSSPLFVVLLEGPVCIILLLIERRLGMLVVLLAFSCISLVDALVVTLCVIVPSLAFLEGEDWDLLFSRRKLLVGVWLVALAATMPFLSSCYSGQRPWYQVGMYQSFIGLLLLAVLYLLILAAKSALFDLIRAGGLRAYLRDCLILKFHKLSTTLSVAGVPRWPVILTLAFWFANGMSPYLGWKFHYSFAMLSNLRVDDTRWNHFIVPNWIRLTRNDPFVKVTKVQIHNTIAGSKTEMPISTELYSPNEFRKRVERLLRLPEGLGLEIHLVHQGITHEFAGGIQDCGIAEFCQSLDSTSMLFHKKLSLEGPQSCCH